MKKAAAIELLNSQNKIPTEYLLLRDARQRSFLVSDAAAKSRRLQGVWILHR
jgi:hypothetical protein